LKRDKKHGFYKDKQLYLLIIVIEILETSYFKRTVPWKVVDKLLLNKNSKLDSEISNSS
jgi:hypothetical protein